MTSIPPDKLQIGRALLAAGPLTQELLQRELRLPLPSEQGHLLAGRERRTRDVGGVHQRVVHHDRAHDRAALPAQQRLRPLAAGAPGEPVGVAQADQGQARGTRRDLACRGRADFRLRRR